MKRSLFLAVLLALLAAPVIAHVVESAQFAFLSRDHVTVESTLSEFSTFVSGTLLLVR